MGIPRLDRSTIDRCVLLCRQRSPPALSLSGAIISLLIASTTTEDLDDLHLLSLNHVYCVESVHAEAMAIHSPGVGVAREDVAVAL
ncbi:MAG: hypothetical protein ACE5IJ_12420 [Thermoplasmata archaeon]